MFVLGDDGIHGAELVRAKLAWKDKRKTVVTGGCFKIGGIEAGKWDRI